jgi:hypothetical protein
MLFGRDPQRSQPLDNQQAGGVVAAVPVAAADN